MSGKLIGIDGFEGAGKSSQAETLAGKLRIHHELPCQVLREPGGDDFGEKMRAMLKHRGNAVITPMAELLAFNAARYNLHELVIAPLLAKGVNVILDRTYVSSLTYQGYGRRYEGADLERLRQICQLAVEPAPPDLIVLLGVSLDTSRERIARRGEKTDWFESQPEEYLDRVRYGYEAEAAVSGHPLIDANQCYKDVHEDILAAVLSIFD